MNKLVVLFVLIVASGVALFFWRNTQNTPVQPPAVTMASIQKDIRSGAKLIDVRSPDEYSSGHIEGALNWPLTDMQAGKLPEVSKNTKIFVYCQSGKRALQATALLKNAGYTNVTNLHKIGDVEGLGGKVVTN